MLFGVSASWGPGVHLGMVAPLVSSPARERVPAADLRTFHLWGATLLPPPTPAPAPPATPTAPPDPTKH